MVKVIGAGQPCLATLWGVEPGIVPGKYPARHCAATLGGADRGVTGVTRGRADAERRSRIGGHGEKSRGCAALPSGECIGGFHELSHGGKLVNVTPTLGGTARQSSEGCFPGIVDCRGA